MTTTEEKTQLEEFFEAYQEGQAAIQELATLKGVLALAIDKLPKKQIRVSLSEQAHLQELDVQYKVEGNGSLVIRSVKA